MNTPSMPSSHRLIQYLVLAEIALLVLAVVASFVQDRFLSAPLQLYQTSVAEADPTPALWVSIGLGVPALLLSIVAWVLLGRGSRFGRRIYTIACLISFPAIAFGGPVVQTGIADCIDTLLGMVAGAILCLSYFPNPTRTP